MKKKLQEVAATEKRSPSSSTGLQRQSSYESSRPAGSSFPGGGRVLGGHSSGGNAMHSSSSTPVGAGRSSYGARSSSSVPGGGDHHASGVGSSATSAGGGYALGMAESVGVKNLGRRTLMIAERGGGTNNSFLSGLTISTIITATITFHYPNVKASIWSHTNKFFCGGLI